MLLPRKIVVLVSAMACFIGCPAYAQIDDTQIPPRLCSDIDENRSIDEITELGSYIAMDGSAIVEPRDILGLGKQANDKGLPLVVIGGVMAGADFNNAAFGKMCFIGTNLEGADFSFSGGVLAFIGSNLADSDFGGAQMPGVKFHDSDLSQMDASGAIFSGGYFSGGWFDSAVSGWNLNGADMSRFIFNCGITLDDGCPVYQGGEPVSARAADFYKADLSSFSLFDADLTAAILNQAKISPRQLLQFAEASFQGGIWLNGGDIHVRLTEDEAVALIGDARTIKTSNDQPSFDCAKANGIIETLVCAEYESELRILDRRMAAVYAIARAQKPTVRISQQAWLKDRNVCATVDETERRECVEGMYQDRIGELVGEFGNREWLAPGESALFVDDLLPLSNTMRTSPLFVRIAPVLAAASFSEVVVTRNIDGSYDIIGEAVGANAHLCSLSAKGAVLDPKNGWYIVPHDETASFARVFRIIGDELQIIGNGKPERNEDDMASVDYVSCGMRASFGDMRRLLVSPDIIESYRAGLSEIY